MLAHQGVVAGMFPHQLICVSSAIVTHLTHLRQPSEAAWQIFGVNAAAWQIILVNVAAWQPARAVCVTFVIKSLLVLLHVLFNLYYLLLLK